MIEKVLNNVEILILKSKGENEKAQPIPREKASKVAESAVYRPLLLSDLYVNCVYKTQPLLATALLKPKDHACNRNRDPSFVFSIVFSLGFVPPRARPRPVFLFLPALFGKLNTNLIFVTQGHLLPPKASFTECSHSFRPHIHASFYSSSSVLVLWAMPECVKRLPHRLCV